MIELGRRRSASSPGTGAVTAHLHKHHLLLHLISRGSTSTGGGGFIVIPRDGESAEGTEELVTAAAVILHNGTKFIPFLTLLFSFNPLFRLLFLFSSSSPLPPTCVLRFSSRAAELSALHICMCSNRIKRMPGQAFLIESLPDARSYVRGGGGLPHGAEL